MTSASATCSGVLQTIWEFSKRLNGLWNLPPTPGPTSTPPSPTPQPVPTTAPTSPSQRPTKAPTLAPTSPTLQPSPTPAPSNTPTPSSTPAPTSTPAPSSTCSKYTTPGGPCGATAGCCQSPQCCSQYGNCGVGDAWCGTGCQPQYGSCTPTTTAAPTFSPTAPTKAPSPTLNPTRVPTAPTTAPTLSPTRAPGTGVPYIPYIDWTLNANVRGGLLNHHVNRWNGDRTISQICTDTPFLTAAFPLCICALYSTRPMSLGTGCLI